MTGVETNTGVDIWFAGAAPQPLPLIEDDMIEDEDIDVDDEEEGRGILRDLASSSLAFASSSF